MSALPALLDPTGRPLTLEPTPIAVGGEGGIYPVVGNPAVVAKVYNAPQPPERSAKLRAMAELATEALTQVAAWPTATLHQVPGGPVAGVLMPRITGSLEIHHLYSVAQRKKDFPDADWRFLIHAARNCALAFEAIHAAGHVIGDVNQKNILVSPPGDRPPRRLRLVPGPRRDRQGLPLRGRRPRVHPARIARPVVSER